MNEKIRLWTNKIHIFGEPFDIDSKSKIDRIDFSFCFDQNSLGDVWVDRVYSEQKPDGEPFDLAYIPIERLDDAAAILQFLAEFNFHERVCQELTTHYCPDFDGAFNYNR